MTASEILKTTFRSKSPLWQKYLDSIAGEKNLPILYHPAACNDLRPLLYTQPGIMKILQIMPPVEYSAPRLFIFSDPVAVKPKRPLQPPVIYEDYRTRITVERNQICELEPDLDNYFYYYDRNYMPCGVKEALGKAFFSYNKVTSKKYGHSFDIPVIYFYYDDCSLIDQLFFRYDLKFSHLVWKKRERDIIYRPYEPLDFLIPFAAKMQTQWFYIDKTFFNADQITLKKGSDIEYRGLCDSYFPLQISEQNFDLDFNLNLKRFGTLKYDYDDVIKLYYKMDAKTT